MKRIFFIVMSLIVISGLLGDVVTSPTGHLYNPMYNQCESFATISAPSYIEIELLDGELTNEIVFNDEDTSIPIYFWRKWLTNVTYEVWADGIQIIDNGFLGINESTPIMIQPLINFHSGLQHIKLEVSYTLFGENYQKEHSIIVRTIPNVDYFQNDYCKLIPYTNGTSDYGAIRPVLFVEGFNIMGDEGGSDYTDHIIRKWKQSLNDSRIYMLILQNGTIDVRDNAMVVLGTLRFIHNIQTAQLIEGTNVIGYSMGGILARYALAFAEDNNINHYCTQYISLDAPHRGGSLNHNMQNMITIMKLIFHNWGYENSMLNNCIEMLHSTTAKQLIRKIIYAEGSENSYAEGTIDFQNYFSEINEEERDIYEEPGQQIHILNEFASSNFEGQVKPGFPYKQNQIKCLAYANGSLEKCGNTALEPNAASYDIHIVASHYYGSAGECDYDCQPGSVFQNVTSNYGGTGYDVHLDQYYAPVVVPTKSSLYLKVKSVDIEGPDNYQYAIDNYDNIYPSDEMLNNHSYFDKLVYATPADTTDWHWRHGELDNDYVEQNIAISKTWMDELDNRNVGSIIGYVADFDPETVTVKMYFGQNLMYEGALSSTGVYNIPYLYINAQTIAARLEFLKPNNLTVQRDIEIAYVNGTISYSPIADVTLCPSDLNNIVVSQNNQGTFATINDAIRFLKGYCASNFYNGEPIRIKVSPGTYEDIDLSPLAFFNIPSFSIVGDGDNVIVDAGGTGICLSVLGMGSIGNIDNLLLQNIIFNCGTIGIYVEMQEPANLTIINCTVLECNGPSRYGNGIYSNVPTTISHCTISDNHGAFDEQASEYSPAGGIYLFNNSSLVSTITDCQIEFNSAWLADAIYLTGPGNFVVRNNKLTDNGDNNENQYRSCVLFEQAGSVDFSNNIIIDNNEPILIKALNSGIGQGRVNIINNTINGNDRCVIFEGSKGKVINNIFKQAMCGISCIGQNNTMEMSYNIFNTSGAVEGFTYNPVTNPGCLFNVDAQLDNNNYIPLWTSAIMSPCIDAGNPDTDGDGIAWNGDGVHFDEDPDDVDIDGTRLDIGAYPAIQHNQDEYKMPINGKIKWLSFPVLNKITNGYTTNENIFAPIVNPNILDWVDWKDGASDRKRMNYQQNTLWNGDQLVSSIWGYKIQLKPSVINQIELDVPGFIQAPNTVIHLYKNENRSTTTPNENWIGYFQPKSAHPFDAFANILGYITSIRSQYWSMARLPQTGVWLMTPGVPVINYGDMVIVTVSQDCYFTWNNSQPTDPRLRTAPVRFEYTEKPDYTPLYLYLDTLEDLPSEIGVYVDGVCKGAVKVEGDFTDVCVYLDANETLNPDNCEIVLYFEAKGIPVVRKTYKPQAEDVSQVYVNGLDYYTMKVDNESDLSVVVPVTSLKQNYPNPFNPSTTISYELAVDGPIILEVYNVKGQKIKTLVNDSKVIGSHKVVWDGTDKYGRAVASGLYNYRLITKDETITKKMLLLK